MARMIILGYGNPLRSDDGLGWRAAENLAQRFDSAEVEIRTCHQLVPELADALSRAETAFFIDAACDGVPGEVKCAPVIPQGGTPSFSHQLTPAAILAWSHLLYGRYPQAFALSVCGCRFDLGENLSPEVSASLPRLVALVGQIAGRLSAFPIPAGVPKDR